MKIVAAAANSTWFPKLPLTSRLRYLLLFALFQSEVLLRPCSIQPPYFIPYALRLKYSPFVTAVMGLLFLNIVAFEFFLILNGGCELNQSFVIDQHEDARSC